jgi:hypothetical protein
MPDWDEDSPELRENLDRIQEQLPQEAAKREVPTREIARRWQKLFMQGLKADDPKYVGAFRGEPGLEDIGARIGNYRGTRAIHVARDLENFERELQKKVADLDKALSPGKELTAVELGEVIDLCAWAHAEWVRIHPFANGNGRTARLWADYLAMRYGLPAFVRLRPRPDGGYVEAGIFAMEGDWEPTAQVFLDMLQRFLQGK